MIKILILAIVLYSTVFASYNPTRSKIISTIIKNIDIREYKVIYSDDTELLKDLSLEHNVSYSCLDSNLLILKDKKNLLKNCKNKNIFVLNYDLLYDLPQSFGAFFFKKGRANIVLLKQKLKKQHIKHSKQLELYLEDKLW